MAGGEEMSGLDELTGQVGQAAAAAASDQPNAAAALQVALHGLGTAYVEFGKAILSIDLKKAAAAGDAAGKKKKVCVVAFLPAQSTAALRHLLVDYLEFEHATPIPSAGACVVGPLGPGRTSPGTTTHIIARIMRTQRLCL